MTWVLGSGSIFGYGALIADTRVTLPDGSTADVLQKLHPVTQHLMLGFAGGVRNGFLMLHDMRVALQLEPGLVWWPRIAAWLWWRRGRRIYENLPQEMRDLGCSLLLVGISGEAFPPTGNYSYCVRMSAPDFRPEYIRRGVWAQIGSGTACETALRIAQHQRDDPMNFLVTYGQGEVGLGHGGSAKVLALTIGSRLYREGLATVGEAMQIGLVTGEGCSIANQDITVEAGQPTERRIRAEPVCRTWEEFEQWSQERGLAATAVSTGAT